MNERTNERTKERINEGRKEGTNEWTVEWIVQRKKNKERKMNENEWMSWFVGFVYRNMMDTSYAFALFQRELYQQGIYTDYTVFIQMHICNGLLSHTCRVKIITDQLSTWFSYSQIHPNNPFL